MPFYSSTKHKITAVLLLLFLFVKMYPQEAIYVSPNGNDTCNGSINKPFQTINAALTIARKQNIKTIIIRGGKYYNTSIKITKADSGLTMKSYQNEKVLLYGGIKIQKFEKKGKFSIVTLPTTIHKWDFRMILINNKIANRSRLPETGFFHHLSKENLDKSESDKDNGIEQKLKYTEAILVYQPDEIEKWKDDFKNAEITIPYKFFESYLKLQMIDTTKNYFLFTYPPIKDHCKTDYNYAVWNTRQGVTHPGQWYWDKTLNKIYYWNKENETINELLVPTQNHIITIEDGTTNIRIEGITLLLGNNKLQSENIACIGTDAAISGHHVSNIIIKNVNIKNTSGNGIYLNGKNLHINNLNITNCGGGGIYYNGENITINNCRIDSMGRNFLGAIGIQGSGKKVRISHCDISHTPYSGITISSDSTEVEHCTIDHTITALQDGAAVYSIGHKEVTVRNNLIIGDNMNRFTMGIYFDERSENCLAKDNIVVNSGIPIHCNRDQNITYRNNIFIDSKKQYINYGGSANIAVNNNLFVSPFIQFNGPSPTDAKADTSKMDVKLRKYANPNGITSFQNNLLFIVKEGNSTFNAKLPKVNESALNGTKVIQIDKEAIKLKKLLAKPLVRQHINTQSFNLDKNKINKINQAIGQ